MSEAQIAETLSISAGAVKNYAAKGLAKLRLDPTLADADRLTGVYNRIQGRRRKIITVGAAVIVVAILLIGYLMSPLLHRRALPPTEDPGFPEYFHGYHIVFQHEQPKELRAPRFLTPSTLDGALLVKCSEYGRKERTPVRLNVNGVDVAETNCAQQSIPGEAVIVPVDPVLMRQTGAKPGARVMFLITVGNLLELTPGTPLHAESGVESVAYGEAVAFERFPLPKRPARMLELGRDLSGDFANPAAILQAGGSHTATLAWEGRFLRLYANSQTPGTIRITLNGLLLDNVTWWDYRQAAHHSMPALPTGFVEPPVGVPVTITVEAQHTSGDWFVAVA